MAFKLTYADGQEDTKQKKDDKTRKEDKDEKDDD